MWWVAPYRSQACEDSGAVVLWGFGRCHSFPGEEAWNPQRGGGSPTLTHHYTWGPAPNLSIAKRQQRRRVFVQIDKHLLPLVKARVWKYSLTGVDEELIGNSRVVYIMDGSSEQSCQDLQVSENSLKDKIREGGIWIEATTLQTHPDTIPFIQNVTE